MDKNVLYQIDIREWLENSFGSEVMIPVYGSKKDERYDVFLQSYLVPIKNAEKQLETNTYDVNTLAPGFTQYGAWEDSEVIYDRFNSDIGAETIVIVRNYEGLADENIEIAEEFRLLFNLYFNQQSNEYVDLTNDVIVVNITKEGFVEVHKKYLKRYLAVKEMALVLHMDSKCILSEYDAKLPNDRLAYRSDDGTIFYTLSIGSCNTGSENKNYSLIFGKKIVFGCDIKNCGIWPYDEEKKYIDFIALLSKNEKIANVSVENHKIILAC